MKSSQRVAGPAAACSVGTAAQRRIRRTPEVARTAILDATERLMLGEGYAAVSTRRVAKEAGLAPGLVHYYFATTDDLFIALHRRLTERQMSDLRMALSAANPLKALWECQTNWPHTALGVEFMALTNHRKAIRKELARSTLEARELQAAILKSCTDLDPGLPAVCDAPALAALLTGIARILVNEEAIGIEHGHKELRACVDWAIDLLSRRRPT